MRLHKFLLTAIAVGAFAIPATASADIVTFNFRDGGVVDNLVAADGSGPTSGGDFDPSPVGDVITLDGLTFTIVDIFAPEFIVDGDGNTVRSGNITSAGHTTNISGQQALGIANTTIGNTAFDNLGTTTNNGAESSDLNPDESIIFTFDRDVEFTRINLESFGGVDVFTVSVDGGVSENGFGDAVNAGAGLGALEGVTIAAGTEITFATTGDDSTTSIRIEDFQVHAKPLAVVPEPSSLALLGLLGGVFAARRRR